MPMHQTIAQTLSRALRIIWDPEPRNDAPGNPEIWCLGCCYPSSESLDFPHSFLSDFASKVSLTYRTDFAPIQANSTYFTSDSGWGCMIRSAQSLLATAVIVSTLGRDWRSSPDIDLREAKLLSWFADSPAAPFSIHNFVEQGRLVGGKNPGEWFGPSAAARCVKSLVSAFQESNLRVYIGGDGGDLFQDNFLSVAMEQTSFFPTLILVGHRLGPQKITPVYHEPLKKCLQFPQAIGIAGGHPGSAHYFVAAQADYLYYIDPHHCQLALPLKQDVSAYTPEELASCHARRLRRLQIQEMDPSMLIAFLITSMDDWLDFKKRVDMLDQRCRLLTISKTLAVPDDFDVSDHESLDDLNE